MAVVGRIATARGTHVRLPLLLLFLLTVVMSGSSEK